MAHFLRRTTQLTARSALPSAADKNALSYFDSNNILLEGSGYDSVGRAVASNTRGPQFDSSHRQKFICMLNICLLSTVY